MLKRNSVSQNVERILEEFTVKTIFGAERQGDHGTLDGLAQKKSSFIRLVQKCAK